MKYKISRVIENSGIYYIQFHANNIEFNRLDSGQDYWMNIHDEEIPCILVGNNIYDTQILSNPKKFFNIYNLSQDEIDQLIKDLNESLSKNYKPKDEQSDFFGFSQLNPKKEECKHEFVDYLGLKEQFSYCKYCDLKK